MPFLIERHIEGQAKRNDTFYLIKVFKHFQNSKQRASLFAGLGFILIHQMGPGMSNGDACWDFMNRSVLPLGIELVSISMGFIIYFLIVNFGRKK